MLVRRKNTTPTIVTSTSSAQKKRSDVKVNEPKGLVLNKRRLRDFKAIAYENADVEFLYLRQNEFTVFDPYINLSNLKVLDLSLNAITTAEFLTLLPNLRHLYLTGNNIERLEGFGNLPELETLCLSSNCISSFEGLQMLPSLRVLSLNYNNITSFKHFPHLPSLFALNLVGNPIADARCYRKMAVAVCPTLLSKVDGRVVENSERESIERYRGKVAYCVTEGLIVENEINLEQQSDTFLLESQRSRVGNRSLQLQSIFLSANGPEGIMREGVSISLHVCLQDMRPIDKRKNDIFHSKHLCPVAFKVSGTATEVFVVGSVNQWTEPIPLERCEENDGVFFQTTLYLPPSEYEYRYVVDGVEKISETNKTASKFKQGICNIYKVMEALPDDDSEHDTILHIRWLRHNRFNGFDIISDESGLTYTPTTDDVGHCLRAEVLIYIDGNFHTMFFDITPPIQPGHPTCTRLDIEGVPAEGNALRLTIDYTGGREGESEIHWFRVMPSGEEIALDVLNPREGYTPCLADVGHRLKVEYIPMRDDWVSGNPVVRYTAIVSAGVPVCKNIEIIGTGVQNDSLSLQYDYEGGVEGESKFQWFRINEEHDEFEPINGETSTTYIPTLNDVGKALAVEFTPVSREGIQGEANRLITDIPIAPAIPHITHISIQGTVQEQHRLSVEFDYVGGYQGSHHVQWYRRDGPSLVKVGKANSLNFTPSTREVGHVLEVSIVPVRSDGVRGQEARIATEKVEASPPQLVMFELSCENTRVGERVSVLAEYTGGEQGDSLVEWYRSEQDRPGEFKLVTSGIRLLTYLLTREDLGRHIRVVYTPVRKDGVRGEPKVRLTKVVEPM